MVGLAAGYLVGDREPDPRVLVDEVRADLRAAAALLEVTQVEYEEAIDGQQVVSEQEYRGARSALSRSRARYRGAGRVLGALGHDAVGGIEAGYVELEGLVDEPAPPEQVTETIEGLVTTLEDMAEGG